MCPDSEHDYILREGPGLQISLKICLDWWQASPTITRAPRHDRALVSRGGKRFAALSEHQWSATRVPVLCELLRVHSRLLGCCHGTITALMGSDGGRTMACFRPLCSAGSEWRAYYTGAYNTVSYGIIPMGCQNPSYNLYYFYLIRQITLIFYIYHGCMICEIWAASRKVECPIRDTNFWVSHSLFRFVITIFRRKILRFIASQIYPWVKWFPRSSTRLLKMHQTHICLV